MKKWTWLVAVLALLIPFLVSAPAQAGPEATSAPVTMKAQQIRPAVKYFKGRGLINSRRSADRYLKGTPVRFRKAMARLGAKEINSHGIACSDSPGGVTVEAWHRRGFAVGGVEEGSCGGGLAIWKRSKVGKWTQVDRSTDGWSCAKLRRLGVPATVLSRKKKWRTCYNASSATVPYTHR